MAAAPLLPHLRIDRSHRRVDLDATVVFDIGIDAGAPSHAGRPADVWLELVACTPRSREYESLLAVHARPSHIHQALLMIGLVPGAPMRTTLMDGKFEMTEPSGALVAVSVVTPAKPDSKEIPISRWIIHRETRRNLPDNVWLFTGSIFRQIEGKSVYMADLNGSVISLVNFGDDLLSRDTLKTPQNDQQMWTADESSLPPQGTPVILRLQAGKPRAGASQ